LPWFSALAFHGKQSILAEMKIAVHWFRADLRLADNTALHAACQNADTVIPVFIFDPQILQRADAGAPIVGFMLECLKELEKDVQEAGGKLTFRHGDVEEEMRAVLKATKATHLYYNRDYEPLARKRDTAVEKMARSMGIEVHSFKDGVIHEPHEVLKADGQPYKVFTAYSHAWRAQPMPEVLPGIKYRRTPDHKYIKYPTGIDLPTAQKLGFKIEIPLPPGGEGAGLERLAEFAKKDLLQYGGQRDFPALGATSRLSPHIRLGTLSVRTIIDAVQMAAKNHPAAHQHTNTFITELIWRDFYRQILWHFPHAETSAFKQQYNDLEWENNTRLFQAWCEGRTGYPLVDAGMRQLNTTGWMHNRVRMIVAAFLTKDLLISWQWGERYFMQKLIDADLASNNGGWQWSASTGTDAQPYFRIFNPTSQAKKFDPEGVYIRRFVPEADTLAYPAPIVDHARQRVRALAMFKKP
jgi:deoxyribodipyrimidine photo-lyase